MQKEIGKLALLTLFTLFPGLMSAEAVTIPVTPDSLEQAVAEAAPGTILALAGGEYGTLRLKGTGGSPDLPLTLRSADPADPARFSGMHLDDVHDVMLDGLVLDYQFAAGDPDHFRPFTILHAQNVTLRDARLDGDVAQGVSAEEDGYGYAFGLGVRWSEDISLEDCDVQGFMRGFVISESHGITVRGNDLHGMRSDGMDFAQVENVLIEDNMIRDFERSPISRDHPDMIQFWTSGTTAPSRDIVIRNNVLTAGTGWYTQSIFMRNELVDTGAAGPEMFYRDMTIEGNVIVNAHLHGITVGETAGLVIANNTIIKGTGIKGTEDPAGPWAPRISVASASRDVHILRNVVPAIAEAEPRPDWTVADNFLIQTQSALLPGFYDAVFVAARSGDQNALASFRPLPGGPLDNTGLGAPRLNSLATAAVLTPLIRVIPDEAALNRFTFDARLSAGPTGAIGPEAAASWEFGDGTRAEGLVTSHVFTSAGRQEIRLQIRQTDGQAAATTARLIVPSPNVLSFSAQEGQFTSWVDGVPRPVTGFAPHTGPLPLGGPEPLVIPPGEIATFFEADSFDLKLRLRATGKNPAGEILRVHPSLILRVLSRGTIDVQLDTGGSKPAHLSSPPLRLFAGEWHDIALHYSSRAETLTMEVDGRVVTRGRASGMIPPRKTWGLSLGYPFKDGKSFTGELESLDLTVNADRFVTSP